MDVAAADGVLPQIADGAGKGAVTETDPVGLAADAAADAAVEVDAAVEADAEAEAEADAAAVEAAGLRMKIAVPAAHSMVMQTARVGGNKGGSIMPGGDRSGPQGDGPRTGRAAGFCSGFDQPGYMNPGVGRGFGMGGGWRRGAPGGFGMGSGRGGGRGMGRGFRGGGRGWGHQMPGRGFYGSPDAAAAPEAWGAAPADEGEYLEHEIKALQGQIKAIERRMKQLQREEKAPESGQE